MRDNQATKTEQAIQYIMDKASSENESRYIVGVLASTDWHNLYALQLTPSERQVAVVKSPASKLYPLMKTPVEEVIPLSPAKKAKKSRRATKEEKQARAEELRKLPYQEYLQSPYWQQRRHFAMKQARYSCQICNSKDKKLNVHHRSYERLGQELQTDLIVLCEDCHLIFHRNGKLAEWGKRS